jgi:hypothetical protein
MKPLRSPNIGTASATDGFSLRIHPDLVASFVGTLALGTLHALRAEVIDPEAGTWNLGRPVFWRPLVKNKLVPKAILDVLKLSDELGAMKLLFPRDRYLARLNDLIVKLEKALRKEPFWVGDWIARAPALSTRKPGPRAPLPAAKTLRKAPTRRTKAK